MHSLPALGQALGHANVHETAEVKKREQLPATKESGDYSTNSRAVEKKICVLPQKWPSGGVTIHCVSTLQIQKLVRKSIVRNSYQTAIVSGCPPEYCKNDYQPDPAYGIKGQILWNASVGIGELEDYCLVGIVHEIVALVDARVDGDTRY